MIDRNSSGANELDPLAVTRPGSRDGQGYRPAESAENELPPSGVTPETTPRKPPVPEIAKVRLTRFLGRGGMGDVWLGEHQTLGIKVAVKFLNPQLVGLDSSIAIRFVREAQLAARIDHPNIVRVLDAGQEHDLRYIVMQFVDGGTVGDLVTRTGPLKLDIALRILWQAAQALAAANQHGVVHRDIKPANLLIARDGKVKLADLGLAKSTNAVSSGHSLATTFASQTLGSPYYMAPEQIKDPTQADIRSDIYALGATFYHMLTGHPPFDGNSLYEVMRAHTEEPIPDLRDERSDLPRADELQHITATMLAKEPSQRYQTPEQLLDALRNLSQSKASSPAVLPVSAIKLDSSAEAAGGSQADSPLLDALTNMLETSQESQLQTLSPGRQKSSVPAWAVGVGSAAGVALLIGLMVLMFGGGGNQEPQPKPVDVTDTTPTSPAVVQPTVDATTPTVTEPEPIVVAAPVVIVPPVMTIEPQAPVLPVRPVVPREPEKARPTYNVRTDTPKLAQAIKGYDRGLFMTREGGMVTVWGEEGIEFRKTSDLTLISPPTPGIKGVLDVVQSPRINRMAWGDEQGHLTLTSRQGGQNAQRLGQHDAAARYVSISSDSEHLLSSSDDATVQWWDVRNSQLISTIRVDGTRALPVALFEPQSIRQRLPRRDARAGDNDDLHLGIIGMPNGELHLYSLADGKFRRKLPVTMSDRVTLLNMNAEMGMLAVGDQQGQCRLIDLQQPGDEKVFNGPRSAVTAIDIAGSGRHIAVGYENGSVSLWEVEQGRPAEQYQAHVGPITGIALVPGQPALLTTGADELRMWTLREQPPARPTDGQPGTQDNPRPNPNPGPGTRPGPGTGPNRPPRPR